MYEKLTQVDIGPFLGLIFFQFHPLMLSFFEN
jgi:hypothetical protein